jgi:hypothetical protein
MFDVGDRVKIKQSKFICGLKHRSNHPVTGVITNIDGSYITVRPAYCKWEIEAYPNELERVNEWR